MMKQLVLIITLIIVSCATNQNLNYNNIERDIASFYFSKKQIDKNQKKQILKNLKGYITILTLDNLEFNKENGIYKININSPHSLTHLIILKDGSYKIIDLDSNFDLIKKEFVDFNYDINDSVSYKIHKVISNNKKLKEKTHILPLN